MGHLSQQEFVPLNVAVLTVSDTRDESTDTSGKYLADAAKQAGHNLADKRIVIDDVYQMRAVVSNWIAADNIHAVLITGGTGFTDRDSTPEAITPLFDKSVDGFGELFRQVSYQGYRYFYHSITGYCWASKSHRYFLYAWLYWGLQRWLVNH